MPRAESSRSTGTAAGSASYPYASSSTSSASSSPIQNPVMINGKKKHVCPICERAFTTSGHLARHSRVHTGERNHKCPFPGCETRCSRQDNLQQHYRIHLSPGSRRSSGRSRSGPSARRRAVSTTSSSSSSNTTALSTPPVSTISTTAISSSAPMSSSSSSSMSPPPLAPARIPASSLSSTSVSGYVTEELAPFDSPPPLAPATLPATYSGYEGVVDSPRSGASSASPEPSYTMPNASYHHHQHQAQHQQQQTQQFTYRTIHPQQAYQDEHDAYSAYPYASQAEYPNSGSGSYVQTRASTPVLAGARPTMSSHISRGYHSSSSAGSLNPPSPPSHPGTPTYSVFGEDSIAGAYTSNNSNTVPSSSSSTNTNTTHLGLSQQQQLIQQQSHSSYGMIGRYGGVAEGSPPPTLAPIHLQGAAGRYAPERRATLPRVQHVVPSSAPVQQQPYIHAPQPQGSTMDGFGYGARYDARYQETVGLGGLGHGGWKSHGKGLGAIMG